MAYRIRHKDRSAGAAVRRIARQQVEAALACIDGTTGDAGRTLHEVRKRCKKIRALLRLVHPGLDADGAGNAAFRAIAAPLGPRRDADVLRVAGALEDFSEHPIAKAIADAARERHGDLPRVEGFENIAGRGVQGVVHAGSGSGSGSSVGSGSSGGMGSSGGISGGSASGGAGTSGLGGSGGSGSSGSSGGSTGAGGSMGP